MTTSYAISSRLPVAACSTRLSKYGVVHDATSPYEHSYESWEEFNLDSVPGYIAQAMPLIEDNLDQLADISEPYFPSQASQLMFMIEAVIQARGLLE